MDKNEIILWAVGEWMYLYHTMNYFLNNPFSTAA